MKQSIHKEIQILESKHYIHKHMWSNILSHLEHHY